MEQRLLNLVAERISERGHLRGKTIAWNCHLTSLTEWAAAALLRSGCRLIMTECNSSTSDAAAIRAMENLGISIYLGESGRHQALAASTPDVISDTGLELITVWMQINGLGSQKSDRQASASPGGTAATAKIPSGGCEITTSGIMRLRRLNSLPFPILNINNGRIKSTIENFHGVGQGVVEAYNILSQSSPVGKQACVVGYGNVGAGVAHYLQKSGMHVSVVDADPVRCLAAHYDGFALTTIKDGLSRCDLFVTATGKIGLLRKEDWIHANDGVLVINVGHNKEELALDHLKEISNRCLTISDHLVEYEISSPGSLSRRIRIATDGNPANVVLLTGSPEPTILHLATEILCIEHIAAYSSSLDSRELPVPFLVEKEVAELALEALGLSGCAHSEPDSG